MVDRIVDGGYFENYGVSTALELAKAVHAMDSALAPFVLVISNDPGVPLDADRVPDNTRDTDFLTDLSSLFHSVSRARDARGTLAVAQLRSELEALDGKCGSAVAHIRVWPQDAGTARPACDQHSGKARAVSMSWWLSSPVQLHLIEQIDGKDNCNKDQIAKIWKAIESVCVR